MEERIESRTVFVLCFCTLWCVISGCRRDPTSRLFEAIRDQDAASVSEQLQCGADVNATGPDLYRRTPLHEAVSSECPVEVVRLLLAAGANPNVRDAGGRTPLHFAVSAGTAPVVRLLLDHGADPDILDNRGTSPLSLSFLAPDKAVQQLCLSHSPAQTEEEAYLLEELALSLRNGENTATIKTRSGQSLLHQAADIGSVRAARILVDHGAKVTSYDDRGRQPIHVAAFAGHTEVVRLLLEAKAEIDAKTQDGETALFLAMGAGQGDVVEFLLAHGANPNIVIAGSQLTALHMAVIRGPLGIVKLLVAGGASLKARDALEMTPLLHAVMAGQKDVVQYLVSHGADVQATDIGGRSAAQIARDHGHPELLELLK